ncbi:hypothetical protein M404DRAFT_164563, partial [Pisolithus tinctorius Marx 270]
GSQNGVCAVAFAGKGQVVGGCSNGEVRRWKIEDGQQQGPTMKASDWVCSVVVSQDGRWIVTGDNSHKAILWNAATHEKVHEFAGHKNIVMGVDISSDGTKLATADGVYARIFSFPSGDKLLPSLPHDYVAAVKFSPDGSRLATVSRVNGFRVYSTVDGNILFDSEWSICENQSRVSIASNGRFIACAAGSLVSLWDCVSHEQIGSIISHTTEVRWVALSPSGRYLACGNGKNITIHDLRDVLPLSYFDHAVGVHPLMKRASLTIIMLFLCPS